MDSGISVIKTGETKREEKQRLVKKIPMYRHKFDHELFFSDIAFNYLHWPNRLQWRRWLYRPLGRLIVSLAARPMLKSWSNYRIIVAALVAMLIQC